MPLYLEKDLEVSYKIKDPMGGFADWKARIIDFDPPHYLADEQMEGPFEYWKQEYYFRHLPYEGTEVRNVIYYTPLWGRWENCWMLFLSRTCSSTYWNSDLSN